MSDRPDVRNYYRAKFDNCVDVEFISHKYDECRVKDVCLNGMYLVGNFEHQEGECCFIDQVQENDQTELCLKTLARVIRKDDHGMAVQFSSMPFESYMCLQSSLLNDSDNLNMDERLFKEECPFKVTE